MGDNLVSQVKDKCKDSQYYSLAIDESTDVSDTSHLLVFIRGQSVNTHCPEEEHKAPTRALQPDRSWASHRSSFHVFPASFVSSSSVRLHVPRGRPLLFFPGGTQVKASRGCRVFLMRRTWPSQIQRRCFTSNTMLLKPDLLHISSFLILSCHLTLRILLRHRPSKPLSRLSSFLFVLHVSAA